MSETVGTVATLSRFPVKSMQGERLAEAELTEGGFVGDRAYALVETDTGKVMVRRIIGPNASGALKAGLQLGEFVVCDQFVDRTSGRADTFYDGPETTHVSAADPYCPDLRALLVETARELGIPVQDGGTVVTIQGPRFSTRAESKWFQDAGWDTINMTAYPEGYLARELELCYANISMVTDHDVGVEGADPVSHEQVVTVFNENNERLRELLFAVVPKIPPQPEEHLCATALRGARI